MQITAVNFNLEVKQLNKTKCLRLLSRFDHQAIIYLIYRSIDEEEVWVDGQSLNLLVSEGCCLWVQAEFMHVFVLLGYTVTSVVSARNGRLLVAGAPRFNHTGKVIIFTLKNSGNLTILHALKGQQVL